MYGQLRCWLSLFLFCCMVLWSEEVIAITTAPYYPLQPGDSWTYENNLSGTYTATILSAPVVVNGATTYVLKDSDGLQSYLSNDQNGIRLHRQYDPAVWVEEVGEYRSIDIIYKPPMKFANAETYIGETIYSSGIAATTVSGLGTFNLNYEMTSTIDALEAITVPAGSYQAIKIMQSLQIYGNILGIYQSETSNSISWFTKDIGQVKYSETSPGYEEEVLTSTNVVPKVTPLAGPNGSIVPSTPQYVPVNMTIVFTVTPDPPYLIDSVTGCGGALTDNSFTTGPVSEDCEVVATFYRPGSARLPWLMLLLDDE